MAGVKVLVTTDGSNLSDKAIDTAIDLTKQLGGELIGMTSVVGEAPLTVGQELLQGFQKVVGRKADDFYSFFTARVAAQQTHGALGDAQPLGEVLDQRRVGLAVHRRRGQGDLEPVAVNADDGSPLGARLRVHCDDGGVVLAGRQPAGVRERGLWVGGHV